MQTWLKSPYQNRSPSKRWSPETVQEKNNYTFPDIFLAGKYSHTYVSLFKSTWTLNASRTGNFSFQQAPLFLSTPLPLMTKHSSSSMEFFSHSVNPKIDTNLFSTPHTTENVKDKHHNFLCKCSTLPQCEEQKMCARVSCPILLQTSKHPPAQETKQNICIAHIIRFWANLWNVPYPFLRFRVIRDRFTEPSCLTS